MISEIKEDARETRQTAERARSDAKNNAKQRGRGGKTYREV